MLVGILIGLAIIPVAYVVFAFLGLALYAWAANR